MGRPLVWMMRKTFEDVQELTLTAGDGETIYYTTDESDPTTSSTKYTEPIQISEGTTTVTALPWMTGEFQAFRFRKATP